MDNKFEIPTSWKGVTTVAEARRLVDYGVLLNFAQAKQLKRVFTDEMASELVRHFATRLAERVESRLPEEILIESLLILLVNTQSETVLTAFLEELLLQPEQEAACFVLTEVALTCELSDAAHNEEIFSMAVALVCELGTVIQILKEQYPEEIPDGDKICDHISTYLLSVSNSSNPCIRLSLLHYFGVLEKGVVDKPGFNRIMSRFGHTVLEHLFLQLFDKKTEGVALQYLLENLPFVLEGDNHCQSILHETLKFYMLKKPEKFCLFIHALAATLQENNHSDLSKTIFLQHLGVLLKLVSGLSHRDLGREILATIVGFDEVTFRDELISRIKSDKEIKPFFLMHLDKVIKAHSKGKLATMLNISYKNGKRGRKPSFSKFAHLKTIDQVYFLGSKQSVRAS